ncbi:hypothetical protein KPATCC21470_3305 [Kitasatospora purpeofusca]
MRRSVTLRGHPFTPPAPVPLHNSSGRAGITGRVRVLGGDGAVARVRAAPAPTAFPPLFLPDDSGRFSKDDSRDDCR